MSPIWMTPNQNTGASGNPSGSRMNFLRGGAGINVLARQAGARITIVDMGVAGELKPDPKLISRKIGPGTKNMCLGPAMSGEEAVASIETGIEVLNREADAGLDVFIVSAGT